MRLLVDTHILIWAVAQPERLPAHAKTKLLDADIEKLFSAVSVWEAAIKFALGRTDFATSPSDLIAFATEAGFAELPVKASAAARVAALPLHHRDPFDRLLIAQAIDEEALLLTSDATLAAYGAHILPA